MEKVDAAKLKRMGFINQNDKEFFTVRIRVLAGNIMAEQMAKLSEISQIFGRGYIGLTTRLNVEIPWIKHEHLVEVKRELEKAGLSPGGTGPTVRPIVACKGTICQHGLGDTQLLCRLLDEKYFTLEMPAKLKIGIAGCPNNCAKVQLNDIGFIGQCIVKIDASSCKNCKLCLSACKMRAIEKTDTGVEIDRSKCVNCGDCIKKCSSGAIVKESQGFAMYLGGKFGRKYRIGEKAGGLLTIEQIIEVTGKILEYYRQNAEKGERLGDMINRVGDDWSSGIEGI